MNYPSGADIITRVLKSGREWQRERESDIRRIQPLLLTLKVEEGGTSQ